MNDRFDARERADGWAVVDTTNYNWVRTGLSEEQAKDISKEWNAACGYLNSPEAAC